MHGHSSGKGKGKVRKRGSPSFGAATAAAAAARPEQQRLLAPRTFSPPSEAAYNPQQHASGPALFDPSLGSSSAAASPSSSAMTTTSGSEPPTTTVGGGSGKSEPDEARLASLTQSLSTSARSEESVACNRCRQQKSKCNRARPSCVRCVAKSVECEYGERSDRAVIKYLREDNGKLRAALKYFYHTEMKKRIDESKSENEFNDSINSIKDNFQSNLHQDGGGGSGKRGQRDGMEEHSDLMASVEWYHRGGLHPSSSSQQQQQQQQQRQQQQQGHFWSPYEYNSQNPGSHYFPSQSQRQQHFQYPDADPMDIYEASPAEQTPAGRRQGSGPEPGEAGGGGPEARGGQDQDMGEGEGEGDSSRSTTERGKRRRERKLRRKEKQPRHDRSKRRQSPSASSSSTTVPALTPAYSSISSGTAASYPLGDTAGMENADSPETRAALRHALHLAEYFHDRPISQVYSTFRIYGRNQIIQGKQPIALVLGSADIDVSPLLGLESLLPSSSTTAGGGACAPAAGTAAAAAASASSGRGASGATGATSSAPTATTTTGQSDELPPPPPPTATLPSSVVSAWAVRTVGAIYSNASRPARLGLASLMYRLMRWQIAPTVESFDSVPDVLKPTTLQLLHPHPPFIDYIIWPRVRDLFVRKPSLGATDDIILAINAAIDVDECNFAQAPHSVSQSHAPDAQQEQKTSSSGTGAAIGPTNSSSSEESSSSGSSGSSGFSGASTAPSNPYASNSSRNDPSSSSSASSSSTATATQGLAGGSTTKKEVYAALEDGFGHRLTDDFVQHICNHEHWYIKGDVIPELQDYVRFVSNLTTAEQETGAGGGAMASAAAAAT